MRHSISALALLGAALLPGAPAAALQADAGVGVGTPLVQCSQAGTGEDWRAAARALLCASPKVLGDDEVRAGETSLLTCVGAEVPKIDVAKIRHSSSGQTNVAMSSCSAQQFALIAVYERLLLADWAAQGLGQATREERRTSFRRWGSPLLEELVFQRTRAALKARAAAAPQ